MSEEIKRHHEYRAEASAFGGKLELPLSSHVPPQASVSLPACGGYVAQNAGPFQVGNVCSFRSAYTHVGGNRDTKDGHGWSTLVTAVIEGLNVLDVITADRIVAQIGTEHPREGYVPSVTFLGTRYDNFRIAGEPVDVDLDLSLFGYKPANDMPYTRDKEFMNKVAQQHEAMRAHRDLPAKVAEHYNRVPRNQENVERIECSLVSKIEPICPGRVYGNAIDIPNFGLVMLGELSLVQSQFVPGSSTPMVTTIQLTMLSLEMGCIGAGKITVSSAITNGHTKP